MESGEGRPAEERPRRTDVLSLHHPCTSAGIEPALSVNTFYLEMDFDVRAMQWVGEMRARCFIRSNDAPVGKGEARRAILRGIREEIDKALQEEGK